MPEVRWLQAHRTKESSSWTLILCSSCGSPLQEDRGQIGTTTSQLSSQLSSQITATVYAFVCLCFNGHLSTLCKYGFLLFKFDHSCPLLSKSLDHEYLVACVGLHHQSPVIRLGMGYQSNAISSAWRQPSSPDTLVHPLKLVAFSQLISGNAGSFAPGPNPILIPLQHYYILL